MTLPVQTPVNRYIYAGSATFTYGFLLLDAADLVVSVNGVPRILGADYTVAGIGTVSGGTVTYLSALTTGDSVALIRDMALERLTDYQDAGDFLAGTFNADFDRLWMAVQDVDTTFSTRSLRAPLGETIGELPPAATRALNLLGFDAAGQPALAGPSSGSVADFALQLVSSFGTTLVGFIQAGTGAVARLLQGKLREIEVSASDYVGFDATMATVSDGAIQAAFDYCAGLPSGGTVRIPTCSMSKVTMRSNVSIKIVSGDVVWQVQPATNIPTGFVKPTGNLSNVRFFGGGRIDGGRVSAPANVSNHTISFSVAAGEVVSDVRVEDITFSNMQEDAIRFTATSLTALAQNIVVRGCRAYVDDASLFESTNRVLCDLIRLQQDFSLSGGYGTYQFKHIEVSKCSAEKIRTLADIKRGCEFFVVSDCRTKNMYDCHHSVDGSRFGVMHGLVGEIEDTTTITGTFTNFVEIQGEHIILSNFSFYGGSKAISGIMITAYGLASWDGGVDPKPNGHRSFKVIVKDGNIDAVVSNAYRIQDGDECVISGCEASFAGAHVAVIEAGTYYNGDGATLLFPVGSEISDINNKGCTSGVLFAQAGVDCIYGACLDVQGNDFYDLATTPSGATAMRDASVWANFRTKHPVKNLNANPYLLSTDLRHWDVSALTSTADAGRAPLNAPCAIRLEDNNAGQILSAPYKASIALTQNDRLYFRAEAAESTSTPSGKWGVLIKEFNASNVQVGSNYWYGTALADTTFRDWTFVHQAQDAACSYITLAIAPAAVFGGDASVVGKTDIANVRFGRQAIGWD